MRPTEWGFKEWGFEGEYGHRVLILDDMWTKQRQTTEKNTACASGDRDEVVRR